MSVSAGHPADDRDDLTPDASYCESLARLAGLLADIPFALEGIFPRESHHGLAALVPADLLEALFWQEAGPLVSDDEPSAVLLAGWPYPLPTGCW